MGYLSLPLSIPVTFLLTAISSSLLTLLIITYTQHRKKLHVPNSARESVHYSAIPPAGEGVEAGENIKANG